MTNSFVRVGNLDADANVDVGTSKISFKNVSVGAGPPGPAPAVTTKAWIYLDTDETPATIYYWKPTSSAWFAAGPSGGSEGPPIIAADLRGTATNRASFLADTDTTLVTSFAVNEGDKFIAEYDDGTGGRWTRNATAIVDGTTNADWFDNELDITVTANHGSVVFASFDIENGFVNYERRVARNGGGSPPFQLVTAGAAFDLWTSPDWITAVQSRLTPFANAVFDAVREGHEFLSAGAGSVAVSKFVDGVDFSVQQGVMIVINSANPAEDGPYECVGGDPTTGPGTPVKTTQWNQRWTDETIAPYNAHEYPLFGGSLVQIGSGAYYGGTFLVTQGDGFHGAVPLLVNDRDVKTHLAVITGPLDALTDQNAVNDEVNTILKDFEARISALEP